MTHATLVILIASTALVAQNSGAGDRVIAHSTEAPTAKRTAASTAPVKPLNLRLPDITTLFTQAQIDQVLSKSVDRDTIEEVEVEGSRLRIPPSSPQVWGGLAAPVWAVMHPTQAWRILAPIPPDRAQYIGNEVPDATDSFRPVSQPPGIASGF